MTDPDETPPHRARPRILLINQYYAPDIAATGVLMTELCEDLASQGYEVTVVAAQPSYTDSDTAAPEHEIRNGVVVHRISLGRSIGRVSMRSRLAGYFKFLFGSRRKANYLVLTNPPDVIVTASNPPLLERVGLGVARRVGAPHVHILHDIHPDVIEASGHIKLPPLMARTWRFISSRTLRRIDRIVVLSENMRDNLVEGKGVTRDHVEVINLWAVPEIKELPDGTSARAQFGIPNDHALILHSGNIGVVQGLDGVIEAAAQLDDVPVTFLLVGDGAAKKSLERRAKDLEIHNLRFLPFQSPEVFESLLAAADLCLVTLKPGMERYSLPSKTFTILAAGKPVLGLMQPGNDVARIVEEHRVGWCASNPEELAAVVRRVSSDRDELHIAGKRAREIYTRSFSRSAGVAAYSEMFRRVIAAHQSRTS